MALTDTKKAKEFMAGAPDIKLKGDLRLQASVDDPFYRDNEGDRDDFSFRMFNKPYKELNPEELEEFQEEMMRLMNKFSSAPDTMDSLNDLSQMLFGKNLDQLTDEEYDALQDAARDTLAAGGRAQYGLGSLVKSVKKAVKGVVKGVKDNPLLAAAALNFAPALIPGGKAMFFGGKSSLFGNPLSLLNLSGKKTGMDAAIDALKIGGAGGIITGLLASKERQPGESDMDFAQRSAQVKDQLDVQFRRLYPQGGNESDEDYDVRISALVEGADDQTVPVGEMADGGRVGYSDGTKKTQLELPFGEPDYYIGKGKNRVGIYIQPDGKRYAVPVGPGGLPDYAMGGRVSRAFGSDKLVEQAAGIEGLPININSKGVKELDLRETGGFIPPVGVKEKADDIPAMLSNNEFVFTADAVRAAGGGSVNKGAQRLYDTMKQLESKVV
jgi:hypothetical protein